MKSVKLVSLILAVVMLAAVAVGCKPKLDEGIAAVAKDYYSYVVLRQDFVSINDICAYDKVEIYEKIYESWAAEEGKSLEDYLSGLAENRGIEGEVTTVEAFFKAQSDRFVNKAKESGDSAKFDVTPEIIEFSDAKNMDIQKVYDALDAKYHREGIYIGDYINYDSIAEGKLVTVGVDGNNSQVLIVKIGNEWLYMA